MLRIHYEKAVLFYKTITFLLSGDHKTQISLPTPKKRRFYKRRFRSFPYSLSHRAKPAGA